MDEDRFLTKSDQIRHDLVMC